MTVEVKSVDTQMSESVTNVAEPDTTNKVLVDVEAETAKGVVVQEEVLEKKTVDAKEQEEEEEEKKAEDEDAVVAKSASFKEETSITSDLREYEKKALNDFRTKLEDAILQNKIFKKKEAEPIKEKPKQEDKKEEEVKNVAEGTDQEKGKAVEEAEKPAEVVEEKVVEDKVEEAVVAVEDEEEEVVDKNISIWGVPLLPSKDAEGTNVVLLKFLRARDFRVNEALEMLINTLKWRKAYKSDSLTEEEMSPSLNSVAYMDGVDREGHPICFNVYGAFQNDELYQKTFGTEEQRQQFLRWRFQLMEKGIQKLDFSQGGVCSILQINDLKNTPGPSKKELRVATKQAVALLQDNYPEFVARNIFINVPFWYYAFNALLSPFLTQRTKSKFVFSRPSNVTETLLKYIPANEIPIKYGGLKRENDTEFSTEEVSDLVVKSGATETIEIPAPEVGTTLVWDVTVVGWEVNYKEEFVPSDEGSYTIIVQKGKKFSFNEEPARNSFTNSEPGKVVLTIDNGSFKKKRILYRYKVKKTSA